MSGPADWSVEIPPEWKTGEWQIIDPVAEGQHGPGNALAVLFVLTDGTNIGAVTWPGGQSLARLGEVTCWGLEERFDGQSPAEAGGVVPKMWAVITQSMIAGFKEAEAELGKRRRRR